MAADDYGCWHHVQHAKYANSNHQLLQFVGARSVVFHNGAYAAECNETCQQEARSYCQIATERCKHKATMCRNV